MTEFLSTDPGGPIVMLATPAYGGVQPLHEIAIIETLRDLAKRGYRTIREFASGNPILPYARANLLGKFRRSGAVWMAMIDGDIGFPGALVGDMLSWAEARSAQAMAAVAPMRDYDIAKVLASGDAMEGVSFAMTPGPDSFSTEKMVDGFIERQCVGTGFILVHYTMIETMVLAHPELRYEEDDLETWGLFQTFIHEGKPIMEDVAFFERWRQLGGKIWVKVDAPMTHTGPMTVGANFRDALLGKLPIVTCSDAKVRRWQKEQIERKDRNP